jgi:hypothetical protein
MMSEERMATPLRAGRTFSGVPEFAALQVDTT